MAGEWGSLRPSDWVLLRYLYLDGSLQAAIPLRVVEDTEDRLVGWLSPGTRMRYWALPDGSDPRTLPLDEMFHAPLTNTLRRWEGNGVLRVIPRGQPFQVLHFFADDYTFTGWYVNFETPAVRAGNVFTSRDWHLDLWVEPNGIARWKDEEEAEAALTAGHLLSDDVTTSRLLGNRLIADPSLLLGLVGDYRDFRPPDSDEPLDLPSSD